jgi:cation:H+ antiporter
VFVSFGLLVLGLALLLAAADLLVRGVCALAAALGVPPLVIAMTIVAFGTSTPEVVVNVISAAHGEGGLAFGNIVGACAVNVGFVLALTALIRPLTVETTIISREIPMMLLAAAGFVVVSEDTFLNRSPVSVLDRSDGLILLLLFCVFLYYTIMQLAAQRPDAFVAEVSQKMTEAQKLLPMPRPRPTLRWRDAALTLGGLVGVAVGGRLAVTGAVGVARGLGVPEVIIGLTLVSFGTTLPELATCIQAARRGQADIVLGNVVGSNIYNLLFIGGLVATISPAVVPDGGLIDVLFMGVLCALLLPIAIRGPRQITRGEGALLLLSYIGYMLYRTTIGLAAD